MKRGVEREALAASRGHTGTIEAEGNIASRHRSDSMRSAAIVVFLTFGMLGVGVIGAIPASSAAGDIFQPDALIKLRSDKDYLGDNVYNSDATDQTRIRLSAP